MSFRDVATQTEPFFVVITTTHDAATNTQHDQWNQPAGRVTAKDAMIMLTGAGFYFLLVRINTDGVLS